MNLVSKYIIICFGLFLIYSGFLMFFNPEKARTVIGKAGSTILINYGELIIRFETGVGKTLTFAARPGQQTSKYYLVADWSSQKGGELKYGNETYVTASSSGNAHLMVVLKKLQRTKRKDRIVKGMKV